MIRKVRPQLTYANVVSTLCLFILLGGSAVAASRLSGKSIKPHSIPGNRLKNHSVTGTQVNLGALGTVPHAANADKLGGSPASDYRLHCPAGLAQGGGLCFDLMTRTPTDWLTALQTCSDANLRLPTEGELATVFNNVGATQLFEWTSTLFNNGTFFAATVLNDNASRQLGFSYANALGGSFPYRCVTNATN